MRCRAVQKRLVAYQDDELSPGDRAKVDEHLTQCAQCHDDDDALFAVTPRPELIVPWQVQHTLSERVDADILWALAQEPVAPTRMRSWNRWWSRDTQFSRGAVLAYATILIGAVAWGATNWWTLSMLEAEIARYDYAQPLDANPGAEIPAVQYRPAAYTPDEEAGYR